MTIEALGWRVAEIWECKLASEAAARIAVRQAFSGTGADLAFAGARP